MNETKIAWTQHTWNAVSGCSRVSDGCKFCYAATLSQKYGWTKTPWTIQNEAENVVIKPHKLHEPYKLPKESARIFTNSMSDMFHRVIPDWYIAVMFCVMLDTPWLTYQVLTKRAERTIDWDARFLEAIQSSEFKAFRETVKDKRVKAALEGEWVSPWGDNIWMGTSVEDRFTLTKRLNQHVMTAKFREGLTAAYRDALEEAGVYAESIKPHIIGTATVVVSEAELGVLREHYGNEMIELSTHSNSGAIEISLPQGAQYLTDNRPTMTEAERAAKGKGTGSAAERKAQAESRRAMRETLRRQLAELHGIDLDAEESED